MILATGPDSASFLHGQLTQDMLHLDDGQARLAGYCSAKGRLLATFKTRAIEGLHHVRESVTNGYKLWTFQGGRVHEADKPKLFQFLWRPRPAELLTDEEAEGVVAAGASASDAAGSDSVVTITSWKWEVIEAFLNKKLLRRDD